MAKIYVLATGEVYQKIKNKKIIMTTNKKVTTDTYGIGGPLDPCAATRFVDTDEWQCFDTLEEARDAADNL